MLSIGIQLDRHVFCDPGERNIGLRTPEGLVLIVGCSHAGIETILETSRPLDAHIRLIVGGFHLVTTPDAEIERIAGALHDTWHVYGMAPGHCTGEPAFAALQRAFGKQYVYAGLGTVIPIT